MEFTLENIPSIVIDTLSPMFKKMGLDQTDPYLYAFTQMLLIVEERLKKQKQHFTSTIADCLAVYQAIKKQKPNVKIFGLVNNVENKFNLKIEKIKINTKQNLYDLIASEILLMFPREIKSYRLVSEISDCGDYFDVCVCVR